MKMPNQSSFFTRVLTPVYKFFSSNSVEALPESRLEILVEDVEITENRPETPAKDAKTQAAEEYYRKFETLQQQIQSLERQLQSLQQQLQSLQVELPQKPKLAEQSPTEKSVTEEVPEHPQVPANRIEARNRRQGLEPETGTRKEKVREPPSNLVKQVVDTNKIEYLDKDIESEFENLWSYIEFGITGHLNRATPVTHYAIIVAREGDKEKSRPRPPSDKNRVFSLISVLTDILYRDIFCNNFDPRLMMSEKIEDLRSEQSRKHDSDRPKATLLQGRTVKNPMPPELKEVIDKLKKRFGPILLNGYEEDLDFEEVVKMAVRCAFILRTAKGCYEWDQEGLLRGREGRPEKVVSIEKPASAKGTGKIAVGDTYTVFGSVMKTVTSGAKRGQSISISSARTAYTEI